MPRLDYRQHNRADPVRMATELEHHDVGKKFKVPYLATSLRTLALVGRPGSWKKPPGRHKKVTLPVIHAFGMDKDG